MTAKQQFDEQVRRDRAHHTERLAWLSEPQPQYADGTPVAARDVVNFTEASRQCLADETGMIGLNTAPE